VASGDLEILAVPRADDRATVHVTTSVDGFGAVWRDVLDGFFTDAALAVDIVVHDAGATPGTVALRLAQLKESATA
jgi:malonate decarboxylase delta subunit